MFRDSSVPAGRWSEALSKFTGTPLDARAPAAKYRV